MSSHYETLYIVPPTLTDDEVQAIAEQYKAVVERLGGTVEKAEKWERRKLAYEIEDHKEGVYIIMLFSAPSELPAELNRLMRINETILRHTILRIEPAVS